MVSASVIMINPKSSNAHRLKGYPRLLANHFKFSQSLHGLWNVTFEGWPDHKKRSLCHKLLVRSQRNGVTNALWGMTIEGGTLRYVRLLNCELASRVISLDLSIFGWRVLLFPNCFLLHLIVGLLWSLNWTSFKTTEKSG